MFTDEKAKGEVPDFKLGTLRLSTAIRIGSKIRPQCRGSFFRDGGSCAVGAALEAVFGVNDFFDEKVRSPERVWPGVRWIRVYLMNDDSTMTREQIADVLEWQGY